MRLGEEDTVVSVACINEQEAEESIVSATGKLEKNPVD
jgi:hypothetical protein